MLYFIYFLFYIISNNTETLLQLGNASLTRTFLIETSHYRLIPTTLNKERTQVWRSDVGERLIYIDKCS